MASKKNSKTSKTAHVLTLLSGGAPSEERPESPPQDQADTQAAPAPVSSAPEPEPRRPLTPPILEVSRPTPRRCPLRSRTPWKMPWRRICWQKCRLSLRKSLSP